MNSSFTVLSYCHSAHKKWLSNWLQQLEKQTCQDFDILFIKHNWVTRDQPVELLQAKTLFGSRLRIVSFSSEPIIGKVINYGVSLIDTEHFIFHDVDDLSHPNRFRFQFEYIKNMPTTDILGTRCLGFSGKPDIKMYNVNYHDTSSNIMKYLDEPVLWDTPKIKEAILVRGLNPLAHGSILMRCDTLKRIGGFDLSDVKINGKSPDHETWKKALLAGCNIARLPQLLYLWRLDSSSIRV
jgi:hypothetical protein